MISNFATQKQFASLPQAFYNYSSSQVTILYAKSFYFGSSSDFGSKGQFIRRQTSSVANK
jgi:hypothetical protein